MDISKPGHNSQIDKGRVGKRFGASASSYDRYALAQQHIYRRMLEWLAPHEGRAWQSVLEIGCGTCGLSKHIDAHHQVEHWTLNDLDDKMCLEGAFAPRLAPAPRYLIGDAEAIELGTGYDLIVSASAIQWMHAPGVFVQRLYQRLRPGGVLLLSTFGPSNLSEIRQLTGQGLDYTPSMQVAHWLDALAPSVRVEEELYPLSFASPREVLLHLKRTGVTATTTASDGFWTASKLRAFEEAYQRLFASPTGGVSLSYHPIYLMAERPRE